MMASLSRPALRGTFHPSLRGTMVLGGAAALAFAVAAYARYGLVEPSDIGLACDTGANTTLCITRRVFINLFTLSAFGMGALAAVFLAFIRPATLSIAAAVVLGVMGCVLYNTGMSAVALSLLPLVFARRAPHKEFQPD